MLAAGMRAACHVIEVAHADGDNTPCRVFYFTDMWCALHRSVSKHIVLFMYMYVCMHAWVLTETP